MQKSWDRRQALAAQHSGTIKSETPDEIVVTFPVYTRAAAFYDEMVSRGFVVKQPKVGGDVHVLRKEEDYG